MLFDQIGQALLLLTIQPADQSGEKKPQGGNVTHGGSLHYRPNAETERRLRSGTVRARYNYAFVNARIEREARQDRPQSKPPAQSEADRRLGTFGAPNMGTHRREERSVRPAKDW